MKKLAMGVGRTTEESFNGALGAALRRTSVRWSEAPECIQVEETNLLHAQSSLKPDILINDGVFPPVIIECSFSATDADQDATRRLGLETRRGRFRIRTVIALHIPERFRRIQGFTITDTLLRSEPLAYTVHQLSERRGQTSITDASHRRWPKRGFIEGTVFDLASLLPSIGSPRERMEDIAESVARLVKEAASGLEITLTSRQQQEIAHHLHQRSPLKGLRTMMVLWLNALLTQQRLATQGAEAVPHVDLVSDTYPDVLTQMNIWRAINQRNWNSVFDPAIDVLRLSSQFNPAETSRILFKLISAVLQIETAQLGLHISVGAELFPKLSEDRKQAAAFYTQPATAELLAGLAITPTTLTPDEWADADLFRKCHLSDLACGTGTLLRAGYRRIATFHEQTGGTVESLERLHTHAMEGGLIGTDISPIAAHLTSSSLAALGYGAPYGDTQIGWVDVGGGKGQTGSLEYFATQKIVDLFNVGSGKSTGNGNNGENSVAIPDASLDWVLMNPPYSRTRGGQSVFDVAGLSDAERRACQKRWRFLVKNEEVNNQAGLAASFLALARRKCKPGGRIGFVLPLSAAFAESWSITRRMMEKEFEDLLAITIASGQALGKRALSADTGMEEMLLVGTKRANHHANGEPASARIHCMTLREPILRVGEAGEVARAIQRAMENMQGSTTSYPVQIGQDEIGQICVFTVKLPGAPWSPLGVLHADLALAANALLGGKLLFNGHAVPIEVPMALMKDLFEIGPTHDLIGHLSGRDPRGAFEFHPVVDSVDAMGPDRALWNANSKVQKRLIVPLTHKGTAPKGVGSEAKREAMRQFRSTLFYARNMRWTSQTLLTATATYHGMGGRAWTSLQHEDKRVYKAFALWGNSTLGFLVHWTQGQRTQSGRATTQMKALASIPCPRLDQIPEVRLDQAVLAFDALSNKELLPACQAHADEVRKKIDQAVLEMLNLYHGQIPETLKTLRWLWCNEPSVHGQNQTALALLEEYRNNSTPCEVPTASTTTI
ncbi:MAG: hypothetical protein F4069_11745 [Rhodothermaceae bacterium]|nr:hypothetical protein [Rhodothermaceae bacterium]MYJ45970.1 hypothetical protein [Rhodothermaceae bacterium]